MFAELFLELHFVHCKASLQCSTHACHEAGRTSAALPADVQAPVLHSTASSGPAISVLSQQDCVSALVAAAQQGPEPCSCQDGISHSQVTSCNLVAQASTPASIAASFFCTACDCADVVCYICRQTSLRVLPG